MAGKLIVFLAAIAVTVPATAQIPDEFENLEFFPKDISREELVGAMRHFSFALGVRCQHCHVGGDGVSFDGVEFDKDGPAKERARFMLEMTRDLNERVLAELTDPDDPPLRIQCKTCHRGRPKPMLLTQEMRIAVDASGVEAGIDRYRMLREEYERAGAYDFREWEVNTLAEDLQKEGRDEDAIAVYELNQEYFPDSVAIAMQLGQLYENVDDAEAAIRNYQRVLTANPDHEQAKDRLEALKR